MLFFGERQIITDSVQQSVGADILQRRPRQYRHDASTHYRLPQIACKLFGAYLFAAQIFFDKSVIDFGNRFDKFLPVGVYLSLQRGRHFTLFSICSCVGFHCQEIGYSLEAVLSADSQLQRQAFRAQFRPDFFHGPDIIGIFTVHLVDKDKARHPGFFTVLPHLLGAHLNTRCRTNNDYRAFADTHTRFHFTDKIGIPRGIDYINFLVLPFAGEQG